MAGIYDIVRGDASERLNVSLIQTELMGFALGVRTQADALANLEAEFGRALVGQELTDLNNMASEFAAGNVQSKLVYVHKVHFAMNAVELELIDEATFRSVLNI